MRGGGYFARRWRLVLLGLVSTFCMWAVCSVAESGQSRSLTKIEARQLSPEFVKRRALDQLRDILVLQTYPKSTQRPRFPLRDLWFWTKSHATWIPGLCTADELTLWLEPVGSELKGADTETKVSGLHAISYYYFVTLPGAVSLEAVTLPELKKADNKCARLQPQESFFFKAIDEEHATEGIWLINSALNQARQGSVAFDLNCAIRVRDAAQCLGILARNKVTDVSEIRNCESTESDGGSMMCRAIIFLPESLEVRIYTNDLPDEKILRVVIHQLLTVGSTRTD